MAIPIGGGVVLVAGGLWTGVIAYDRIVEALGPFAKLVPIGLVLLVLYGLAQSTQSSRR